MDDSDKDVANNRAGDTGNTISTNLSPRVYEGTDVNNKVNCSSDGIIHHPQQLKLCTVRPHLPNAATVDERDFLQSGIQPQQSQEQSQQAGQLHHPQQQIMEDCNHSAFLSGATGSTVSTDQQNAQSGASFSPEQSMPPPSSSHNQHLSMYGQ